MVDLSLAGEVVFKASEERVGHQRGLSDASERIVKTNPDVRNKSDHIVGELV